MHLLVAPSRLCSEEIDFEHRNPKTRQKDAADKRVPQPMNSIMAAELLVHKGTASEIGTHPVLVEWLLSESWVHPLGPVARERTSTSGTTRSHSAGLTVSAVVAILVGTDEGRIQCGSTTRLSSRSPGVAILWSRRRLSVQQRASVMGESRGSLGEEAAARFYTVALQPSENGSDVRMGSIGKASGSVPENCPSQPSSNKTQERVYLH